MKKVAVHKSGWNIAALFLGPFWYFYRGIFLKGSILLFIAIVTLGIGIIPIWIYCGYNANKDFYKLLKRRNISIYH